jgi:hypothetical protein
VDDLLKYDPDGDFVEGHLARLDGAARIVSALPGMSGVMTCQGGTYSDYLQKGRRVILGTTAVRCSQDRVDSRSRARREVSNEVSSPLKRVQMGTETVKGHASLKWTARKATPTIKIVGRRPGSASYRPR